MKNDKKNQGKTQPKISDPSFRNANTEHAARIMFLLGLVAYPFALAVLLPTGIALDFNQNGESLRTSKIQRDYPQADKKNIKQIRKERNKQNLQRANQFAHNLVDGLYEVLYENTLGAAESKISERNAKYKAQIDAARKAEEDAKKQKEIEEKKQTEQATIKYIKNTRKSLMSEYNVDSSDAKRMMTEDGLELLVDFIANAKKINADYDQISVTSDGVKCKTTITIDDKVRLDEMIVQMREQTYDEYKTVFTFANSANPRGRFVLFGLCQKRQAELQRIEAENKKNQLRNQLAILKNKQNTK